MQEGFDGRGQLGQLEPSQALEHICDVQHLCGSKNLWNVRNENLKF